MRARPLVVGAFVLGAIVLAIAAVVLIGTLSPFEKRARLVTYVSESVSGLDVGSEVKLQGVRIGRVSSLTVTFDPETNETVTVVSYEVRNEAIVDREGRPLGLGEPEVVEELVRKGLRAQIELQGITGIRFLGLQFVDPRRHPPREPRRWLTAGDWPAVVPWIPSTLSELTAAISDILGELKGADVPAVSRDLRELLRTATETIRDAPVREAVEGVAAAAEALRDLATSPRVAGALDAVARAAEALAAVAGGLDERTREGARDLGATLEEARAALASFRGAADTMQRAAAGGAEVGVEAERALARLARAAAAVERLADYLERNPDALLRGRAGRDGR